MVGTIAGRYGRVNSAWLISLPAIGRDNPAMDVFDIRLRNLQGLLEARRDPDNSRSKGVAPLARELGKADAQIQQYATGHRRIGDKFARELEAKLGLKSGWMDQDQTLGVRDDAGQYMLSLDEETAALVKVWQDLPVGLRWDLVERIEQYQRLHNRSPDIARSMWAGPSRRTREQEKRIEAWQARVHSGKIHHDQGDGS